MEAKHNLITSTTDLIFTPEDIAQFDTEGMVTANSPYMDIEEPIEVFKVSKRYAKGQKHPTYDAPVASFSLGGLLSVQLPTSHGERLRLPISIPYEAISASRHKDRFFGKTGQIMLVGVSASEKSN